MVGAPHQWPRHCQWISCGHRTVAGAPPAEDFTRTSVHSFITTPDGNYTLLTIIYALMRRLAQLGHHSTGRVKFIDLHDLPPIWIDEDTTTIEISSEEKST